MKSKILIVEDELDIQELIGFYLEKEGFETIRVSNGNSALERVQENQFDCVILDIMIPGKSGLEVLKEIRFKMESKVPIIIASARGEDTDIITGLELGADEYLTKPFSPQVLSAKVKAMIRYRKVVNPEIDKDSILTGCGLKIDKTHHSCHLNANELNLTATEFSLLSILVWNEGRVFTREHLINSIKGNDYPVTQRSIDVQIASIRKKLGDAGSYLKTVWSVGYKYQEE